MSGEIHQMLGTINKRLEELLFLKHDLDELNDQWFKNIDDLDGVIKYATKTVKLDTDPIDWELSHFR